MLEQHNQFLLADKALETSSSVWISIGNNWGTITCPGSILGLREQVLHELLVAGNFNLDMALANTTPATTVLVEIIAVDCVNCLFEVDELNITVKSLAGDPLHNDMNWLSKGLIDNASIAA
jgi:hypothetical protein